MRFHTNTVNKQIHYFSCGNYIKDTRGDCATRHYVRADALEQIVQSELCRLAGFLKHDENALAELLEKKTNRDILNERKLLERELQAAIARQQTVSDLHVKVYEDNAAGRVTDEWFMELSRKYEVERVELKAKIAELRTKLSSMHHAQQSKDAFLAAIRKFMSMDELTAPLVRELIDHIDVYEAEGKGRNRVQRIVIYYRFIGYIEIPEEMLDAESYVQDTLQGVSINYLPKALPEQQPA